MQVDKGGTNIKLTGIIMVLLGGFLAGLFASVQLGIRLEQLKTLRRIFLYLKQEIAYSRAPLPEALAEIGRKVDEPFSEFLLSISKELKAYTGKPFHEIFKEQIHIYLTKTALKDKELNKLEEVGEFLGFLNGDTQIKTIDLYIAELDEEIELLSESLPEKQKVFKTLGIMGGLFLTILFI